MSKSITVKIMNPEEVVWEGKAEALSSENTEGPFDILPDHANFMTLLNDAEVVVHLEGEKSRSFSFDQAVLYFHDGTAAIYVHTDQTHVSKDDKV